MKSISRELQKEIADRAEQADETAKEVRAALSTLNDAIARHLASLELVRAEYNTAISALRETYEALAAEAENYFADRSARWQQSEAGTDYQEWTNSLTETAEALPDLDEFIVETIEKPEELFDADTFIWPDNAPSD
jgi:hypothetical protein